MPNLTTEQLALVLPFAKGAVLAIGIFILGWMISKWAERMALRSLRRTKTDEALSRFLASIARYTVIAATIIAALGAVGIQTTSLVAVFASAGLAVGLALQGSLANFASGVMILFFRPFTIDDVVTAGGHTGKVADIGLFATTLMTPDNQTIIVPNSGVTGGPIINIATDGIRRGEIDIGVAYGADLGKVQAVLLAAANKSELVDHTIAPAIAFVNFGASSLDFKVLVWATPGDFIPMLHNVRCAVYDALNEADIEIPFNQIVVHPADGTSLVALQQSA